MRRGAVGQERRAQPMPDATISEGRRFTGTAVVFDTWAQIGAPEWGFRERWMPGSLDKTLREADIVFLDGHEPLRPISRTSADTLRLAPNTAGLGVDSDMDTRVSYVNDLAINVGNGNVKGMSFGFRVTKDEWVRGADGVDERTVREAAVHEISATAFPAFVTTDAAVRSAVLSAKCRRGDLTAAEIRAIAGASIIDPDANTDREALALIGEEGEPPEGTRTQCHCGPNQGPVVAGGAHKDECRAQAHEPADATRAVEFHRLQMRRLAALHGFAI